MHAPTLVWREDIHGPLRKALEIARAEGSLRDDLGRIIYSIFVFVRDHNLDPEPTSVVEYMRQCFGVTIGIFDMRIVQERWVPWIVEALNTDTDDLRPVVYAVGERINGDYYDELRRHYKVTGHI